MKLIEALVIFSTFLQLSCNRFDAINTKRKMQTNNSGDEVNLINEQEDNSIMSIISDTFNGRNVGQNSVNELKTTIEDNVTKVKKVIENFKIDIKNGLVQTKKAIYIIGGACILCIFLFSGSIIYLATSISSLNNAHNPTTDTSWFSPTMRHDWSSPYSEEFQYVPHSFENPLFETGKNQLLYSLANETGAYKICKEVEEKSLMCYSIQEPNQCPNEDVLSNQLKGPYKLKVSNSQLNTWILVSIAGIGGYLLDKIKGCFCKSKRRIYKTKKITISRTEPSLIANITNEDHFSNPKTTHNTNVLDD